ncbi:4Fe-4S cluster-binding domain-containing protein [Candidatus Woesearchaeota archaeon]|nr:4Fe-4S cluster-binding domain-containing protein [Candidatus Woesearchaeota archaeon]
MNNKKISLNKNKYFSYCINGFAEGCKYCVKGEKLVLFINGKCKTNCWYCSLSNERKKQEQSFANEREIKDIKDLFEEVKQSKSTSAGITGGDPLLSIKKTMKYCKFLKEKFGKNFHIHIYLSTKFVNKKNLKKLSKYIDEVRFHPLFLINKNETNKDLEKIRLGKEIFGVENNGIELPMIPNQKEEILSFIKKCKNDVSFVNLNEFELSETNFNFVTKNYKLNQGGYVISDSINAGIWILKNIIKEKINLKVHLCTAELKNKTQFVNRLKRYNVLPYGKKTKEGTVIYLSVYPEKDKKIKKLKKEIHSGFIDYKKNRILIDNKTALKLLKIKKYKIIRTEEFPTYDRLEVEKEEIK